MKYEIILELEPYNKRKIIVEFEDGSSRVIEGFKPHLIFEVAKKILEQLEKDRK